MTIPSTANFASSPVVPTARDVLYSKDSQEHPGNVHFRQLLERRVEDFERASNLEKPQIALELVQDWQEQGGRFLSSDCNNEWKEAGESKAIEKTSRELRQILKTTTTTPQKGQTSQSQLLKACLSQTKVRRRSDQRRQLLDALHSRDKQFVVISGPSGSGKSSFVPTTLADENIIILQGQFDWLGRREPYQALVAAVSDFTHSMLQNEKKEIASFRKRLMTELGPNAPVLTSIIPVLNLLFGKDETSRNYNSSTSRGVDIRQRFVFSLKALLQCLCEQQSQKIVLVLDGLQHADRCSLDVISLLASDMHGLLLVGTIDDSAVETDYYVSQVLREMEGENVRITKIALDCLSEGQVEDFLEDSLRIGPQDASLLSQMLLQMTDGRLYQLFEVLEWLVDREVVYACNGVWCLDRDEILYVPPASMNDLLLHKFVDLAKELRVLQTVACLGPSVQKDQLCMLFGESEQQHLDSAIAKGILEYNTTCSRYDFVHTPIRKVVYELIPDADKESFHLQLARRLWKTLDEDQVDLQIFTIVSNMMIGQRFVTQEKEQEAVANLCLIAGRKAAKSSSFGTASVYFRFGVALLENERRRWRENYELTLALYNAAAEMELCNAEYEKCFSTLQEVFDHARCFEDKVHASQTRIYVLGVNNRQQESLDLGIEVLEQLGEHFPKRPNLRTLWSESRIVKGLLKGKTDEQILRLPSMANNTKLMAMQVLLLLTFSARVIQTKLGPYIILRMIRLTLEHGLTVFASTAFIQFGTLCVVGPKDLRAGFRFGNLGLKLLDWSGAVEYLPRAYTSFYGMIWCWAKPLREGFPPLEKARLVAMQIGDNEYSALAENVYCFHALYADVPLTELVQKWENAEKTMVANRLESLLLNSRPTIQAVYHYSGLSADPLDPKGEVVDYNELFRESLASGARTIALVCRFAQMLLMYVFNSFESAAEHAGYVARHYEKDIPPTYCHILSPCFIVLSRLRSLNGRSRRTISHAKAVIKQFKKWVKISPHNVMHMLYLMQAEVASVRGQNELAYEKYLCAIALAEKERSLLLLGLAFERFARHLLEVGGSASALPYFQQALFTYTNWRAMAKVEHLSSELAELYPFISFVVSED